MKSKLVTFLLCTFLGNLGVHRFYVGKIGTGILYLFTLGFCGIGTFIDLIRIAGNSFKDKDGYDLNEDIPVFVPWIVVGIYIFIFFIGFWGGIFSVSEDVATEPKNVVEEHIEDKKVEVEIPIEVETEPFEKIEESKTTTAEPVEKTVTTEDLEKILQKLEEENSNNNVYSSSTENTNRDKFYSVGDVATAKSYKLTVEGCKSFESDNMFSEPEDGKEFVEVSLFIENISDEEIHVSSIMCFDAYVDGYSIDESFNAQIASSKDSMNGTIAAGKKLCGSLFYELPINWSELEIHIDLGYSSKDEIKLLIKN